MIQSNKNPFEGAPIIYSYSRKQALEDGVLVDLTEWAKETGFSISVACTVAVWNQYVEPPESSRAAGQSERGRAHDLLTMLYVAIKKQPGAADLLTFEVIFLNAIGKQETVKLKAICGPGDDAEPVLTLMLPSED
jgi:Family of unknown function (DUF6573)